MLRMIYMDNFYDYREAEVCEIKDMKYPFSECFRGVAMWKSAPSIWYDKEERKTESIRLLLRIGSFNRIDENTGMVYYRPHHRIRTRNWK